MPATPRTAGCSVELTRCCAAEADDRVAVIILAGNGPQLLRRVRHGEHRSRSTRNSPARRSTRRSGSTQAPPRLTSNAARCRSGTITSSACRWRDLRKITIAQVHGNVISAGLDADGAWRPIVAAEDYDVRRYRRHLARHAWRRISGPSMEFGPRKELLPPATASTPTRPAPPGHGRCKGFSLDELPTLSRLLSVSRAGLPWHGC